ncbi:MAG: hypothetical protein N3B17_01260 [Chlorobi bacterium]|nr:hypothetical protein [Chlorobiota bacterium]
MKHPLLYAAVIAAFVLVGCDPHRNDHGDDHAVPGRFTLRLTSDRDTVVANWSDLDGPGGQAPVIDTIALRPGEYSGTLSIMTTSGDSLTPTIRAQATEHQLFYTVSGTTAGVVTITITDRDSRGMPLGLDTRWQVGTVQAPLSGTVNIKLYHYEPNKKDGASPSPETDADITFPLRVQP